MTPDSDSSGSGASGGAVQQPADDDQPRIRFVTLLESDLPKLVMSGHLSRRTTFQIRVEGPFGARERRALRQLVEANLSVLDDEMPEPSITGRWFSGSWLRE